MKNSFCLVLCWMIGGAFSFDACYTSPQAQPQAEASSVIMDTLLVAKPDVQDLLFLLRGKWQNEADSSYQIQITDTLMQHYYHGNFLRQGSLEVDAACVAVSCVADSTSESGWCILEKDSSRTECLQVLKCDEKVLQIHSLGTGGPKLMFRKL